MHCPGLWRAIVNSMKIFDGYNVIGAGRKLGLDLSQDDKEERLLRLLAKYRSRKRSRGRFLVVFDGDYGRLAEGGRKVSRFGIDVEWAVGESADSLIVRKVRNSANPREVEVITSDREVLLGIRDHRARGVRSGDFLEEVRKLLGEDLAAEKPDTPSAGEVQEWLDLFAEREKGEEGGER
jgi:predicted RNA-binding protein with PIN domain